MNYLLEFYTYLYTIAGFSFDISSGEYFIAHFIVLLVQIVCESIHGVLEFLRWLHVMPNIRDDLVFLHFVSVETKKNSYVMKQFSKLCSIFHLPEYIIWLAKLHAQNILWWKVYVRIQI